MLGLFRSIANQIAWTVTLILAGIVVILVIEILLEFRRRRVL